MARLAPVRPALLHCETTSNTISHSKNALQCDHVRAHKVNYGLMNLRELSLARLSQLSADAILQLRPYFRDVPPAEAEDFTTHVPARHRQGAIDALQLARAVQAKAAGATPAPIDASVVLNSRSTNLDEETAELLRLARWWPHAEAAATQQPEMSEHP